MNGSNKTVHSPIGRLRFINSCPKIKCAALAAHDIIRSEIKDINDNETLDEEKNDAIAENASLRHGNNAASYEVRQVSSGKDVVWCANSHANGPSQRASAW
jgi:hypothetical protein